MLLQYTGLGNKNIQYYTFRESRVSVPCKGRAIPNLGGLVCTKKPSHPLHTRATSRDHWIVRAQKTKKVS
jgi:hypothetical protein